MLVVPTWEKNSKSSSLFSLNANYRGQVVPTLWQSQLCLHQTLKKTEDVH